MDEPSFNGKGDTVDATFTITIGLQTKAFSDGTTVDKLYACVYEVVSSNQYAWVADNSAEPIGITSRSATVTFNDKIELGKSYKIIFWAQKDGACYFIDWAKSGKPGKQPVVLKSYVFTPVN